MNFQTAYCSTKHAIKGLMEGIFMELRQEHKNNQIKTTTVSTIRTITWIVLIFICFIYLGMYPYIKRPKTNPPLEYTHV